jgi:formylglycine-generating enzyme required for sulfatase activity
LELRKAGYQTFKKDITINEGETCMVNNPLEKEVTTVSSSLNTHSSTTTFTVNGVTFSMVKVDGGTFRMGATEEQGSDADSDEEPVRKVILSSYYIGVTEVTQALWQAVMGNNPSYYKGDNRPVESVSWNDCQKFIKKLNSLTGRTFRLPTEAEWEYAARGGNRSKGYKYSGSNKLSEVAWYTDNSRATTHQVAGKIPNELGLYDMSGNIWEWCNDRFGSYSSTPQTDPKGSTNGSFRVNRGGGWSYGARHCRVSNRDYYTPDASRDNLGLRLCLSPVR